MNQPKQADDTRSFSWLFALFAAGLVGGWALREHLLWLGLALQLIAVWLPLLVQLATGWRITGRDWVGRKAQADDQAFEGLVLVFWAVFAAGMSWLLWPRGQ